MALKMRNNDIMILAAVMFVIITAIITASRPVKLQHVSDDDDHFMSTHFKTSSPIHSDAVIINGNVEEIYPGGKNDIIISKESKHKSHQCTNPDNKNCIAEPLFWYSLGNPEMIIYYVLLVLIYAGILIYIVDGNQKAIFIFLLGVAHVSITTIPPGM